MKTIELTDLECKALWLVCMELEYPASFDQAMKDAALRAIDRVWRAEKGMEPREAA